MNELDEIAAMLIRRRKMLGLTQAEVAERAGIDHTHLCHLESGRRHPGPSVIVRWAGGLRIDAALTAQFRCSEWPEAKVIDLSNLRRF